MRLTAANPSFLSILALFGLLSSWSSCPLWGTGVHVLADDDGCLSIPEIACTTEGFETLCELVTSVGLEEVLAEEGPYTVFAPSNSSFELLDSDILDTVLNDTEALTNLLLFHVVAGEALNSSDLSCVPGANLVPMASGRDSRTICQGESVYQKGAGNPRDDMPEIVATDIETCNGIIHIIDKVMLPPTLVSTPTTPTLAPVSTPTTSTLAPVSTPTTPTLAPVSPPTAAPVATPTDGDECQSIADLLCDLDDFSTLCALATQYGFYDQFDIESTSTDFPLWTLFAPTNDAFELIGGAVATLEEDTVINVVSFHAVLDTVVMSSDLLCGQLLTMVNGEDSRTVCEDDKIFQKGSDNLDGLLPEIIDMDIEACNGVIHVVNNVMLPSGTLP